MVIRQSSASIWEYHDSCILGQFSEVLTQTVFWVQHEVQSVDVGRDRAVLLASPVRGRHAFALFFKTSRCIQALSTARKQKSVMDAWRHCWLGGGVDFLGVQPVFSTPAPS